ncbi:YcxB family protein [Ichthyenterobacterium sp. W332]|uniref:YcxB family protein n=1 Tax=Microcosmobacter mediterraneus TaxID=3075607 RepID=A0ABU2YLW5_9FLAO|nr:YcxB family protein [Ichthyenterobacterium sp. W332]MDT0558827.1 YcxB family protein [Ichthyenterobacterium sp. W332]
MTRFRKSWWIYLLLILVAILNLNKFKTDSFSSFIVIFGFCYPLFITVYLYFWSLSNNSLNKPIHMSFDNSVLIIESEGTESKIPISNIQKVINYKQFWLLYISKGQFINVNKDIFFKTEDYKNFTSLINATN